MITILNEKCIKCLSCYHVCPLRAIDLKNGHVSYCRPENCIACGHCQAVCPVLAIDGDHENSIPGKPITKKKAYPFDEVEDLFLSRRSIRAYETQPIDQETIRRLLRIGSHSPTGRNRQDCKFVVIGKKGVESLENMAREYFLNEPKHTVGHLMAYTHYKVLLGAPGMIGFYGEKSSLHSCALAAQTVVLAAHAIGLGTCYNGIFMGCYRNDPAIFEYIGLPAEYMMHFFLMIGYPKSSVVYKHHIERKPPDVIWKDEACKEP